MSSKRGAETEHRLAEIADTLNALERRLDELEDLIDTAWDRIVAPPPEADLSSKLKVES
jgi:hypothetical protein